MIHTTTRTIDDLAGRHWDAWGLVAGTWHYLGSHDNERRARLAAADWERALADAAIAEARRIRLRVPVDERRQPDAPHDAAHPDKISKCYACDATGVPCDEEEE